MVSATAIHGGDAYNVIPQTAAIRGTVRTFRNETMDLVETNMKRIAAGVAAAFGATASVDFRRLFAPLVNDAGRDRRCSPTSRPSWSASRTSSASAT